jgi:acyl dehydratase
LYGDRNPLRSGPEFVAAAGFPRSNLHGLRTYGIACTAILDTFLDSDASQVHSYAGRFAERGFPARCW